MRIVITTDTVGGVWSYATTLAAGLTARSNISVLLAAFGPAPNEQQRAQAATLPGVELRAYPSPLEWQIGSAAEVALAGEWLREQVLQWEADLLHTNQYAFGDLAISRPRVLVAHSDLLSWHEACQPLDGAEPIDPAWREFVEQYATLVRRGLAGAAAVVAPSRYLASAMERLYEHRRPVEVIHNGTPARAEQPAIPRRRPAPLRVFSAGRFWDRGKNVGLLVDAVAEGIEGVEVEVAGAGFQEQGAGLTWLGELAHATLLSRLSSYEVYAGTSRYEPFGLAVLEAAEAGCALVLNDIPVFRELWHGAALFVKRDSPAELRDTLRGLAEDRMLLYSYRRKALNRARRYTAARVADSYLRLYARVIASEAPRRRPARPVAGEAPAGASVKGLLGLER